MATKKPKKIPFEPTYNIICIKNYSSNYSFHCSQADNEPFSLTAYSTVEIFGDEIRWKKAILRSIHFSTNYDWEDWEESDDKQAI